jgi:hypothetical protein
MINVEGEFQFLGVLDALGIIIWFFILLFTVNSTYQKNIEKAHYKYYRTGFYVKFFSAILFSIIYIQFYSGGDSSAYWDTAQKMNNLFWETPNRFFYELFNNDPNRIRYESFEYNVIGMPPNWIYKEDEAWFAAKLFSLLTFITFKSYFAMTMITSFISFRISWLLYEIVLRFNLFSPKSAAIGILFLPSTCFWCTGVTKDMIIYCSVLYLLIQLFTFLNSKELKQYRNWTFTFFAIFLILNIRDFMIITAVGPFFMAIGARLSQKQKNGFSKIFIQLIFISLVLTAMVSFLDSEKGKEFATEAEIIQKDLKTNETYGKNKYDLGLNDFTVSGMLKAMPISVYTAFYRPYLWEGDSIFIRISAIEAIKNFKRD